MIPPCPVLGKKFGYPLLDRFADNTAYMNSSASEKHTLGIIAAYWGLVGVLALLVKAIISLSIMSAEALQFKLTTLQWTLLLGNIAFMAYSEGYMGFQKKFSPRMAARIKHLTHSRNPYELVLAPLFCMAFFNAPKRRIIASYLLLIMIVCLVLAFRLLPQPWRGILDAGVVVGLFWGCISIVWCCYREFVDKHYQGDPELVA